jgi:drug/metabolite transporter (DMT)-like permease
MTESPAAPARSFMDRPYLILILTTLFWGGNVVAGKIAVGHIDAHSLMILRWTGALLLVLPFAIGPLRRDWPVLRQKWWLYLLFGAVGYASFNVFVYVAAYFTTGVNIALEQATINIMVILFNFVLFRTRVRALQLLGVLITVAGIAIIATHGDLTRILRLDLNIGDLLMLLGCFAYAVYSILLRWRPQSDWRSFLVASFIGAILASFAYQATLGNGWGNLGANLAAIDMQGWVIAAYTAIFPSVLSQLFYVRGVELIGSNRASLFINLIPLFGTIGSVLVLGEVLEGFHIVAALLIAAGIVLAEWSAKRGIVRPSGESPG